MKRISYAILLAVVIGVGTIASWVYVKYFRSDEQGAMTFPVALSDITESVKARGKVVSKKEFDLGFESSGTVRNIYVSKSQIVKDGDPLIHLNSKEKESDVSSLEAVLSVKKNDLEKLIAGYTKEDLAVSETKVIGAETALSDAEKNLSDIMAEAYVVSDNAIHNYADTMINNARSDSPSFSFSIPDENLKNKTENVRVDIESTLSSFNRLVGGELPSENLSLINSSVANYLESIRTFLNLLATAVNKAETNTSVTTTEIDTFKTNVAAARTALNTTISDVTGAIEKWRSAQSALELAEKQLLLMQAGTRNEDIVSAKAEIIKAESDLAGATERISRSTLYAPTDGVVRKIWMEIGEIASLGETAISIATSGNQIETEVSELDIVKINVGQSAAITLDALPGKDFYGKVISIDPEPLDKDGDTYYRVTLSMDDPIEGIRPGMSSDITIDIEKKISVMSVPSLTAYKRDGKEYVKILRNGKSSEIEVTLGISDGENVEIISGLNIGDEAIVSTE